MLEGHRLTKEVSLVRCHRLDNIVSGRIVWELTQTVCQRGEVSQLVPF
jgi:hypothetical protein